MVSILLKNEGISMAHLLCIFTPTYNRAYTLRRLYNSLVSQTSHDFYWLVVDDGSCDGTDSMMSAFMLEGKIEIDYIRVENGGKQRAWNVAVERSTSELFMCVDSDDFLVDDAVEIIASKWCSCKRDSSIAGIVTPRAPRTNSFPSDKPLRLSQIYADYGYRGETCIATLTEVVQNSPFWVAQGEKFIPELYVFDRIDRDYLHMPLNQEICKGEYMEDGYTAHYGALLVRNPLSYSEYKRQCAEFATGLPSMARETLLYLSWQKIAGNSVFRAASRAPHRALAYCLVPCAVLISGRIKTIVQNS